MRDADPSDAELLQALRRETDAAGVLYDRYALRLVRYLGQEGASDVVAQALGITSEAKQAGARKPSRSFGASRAFLAQRAVA